MRARVALLNHPGVPMKTTTRWTMLVCSVVLATTGAYACDGDDGGNDDRPYQPASGQETNSTSNTNSTCNADYSIKEIRCGLECGRPAFLDLSELTHDTADCCDDWDIGGCYAHVARLDLTARRDGEPLSDDLLECYRDMEIGLAAVYKQMNTCFHSCMGQAWSDDDCESLEDCAESADTFESITSCDGGHCFDSVCEEVVHSLRHELPYHYGCDCKNSTSQLYNDVILRRINAQEVSQLFSCYSNCARSAQCIQ